MRLKTLKVIYFLILFVIIVRLFYWQIIKFDYLSAKAEEQHVVNSKTEGKRGQIFFNDNSLLATNQQVYDLYASPGDLTDKNQTVDSLAEILVKSSLEKNKIINTEAKETDFFKLFYQKKAEIEKTLDQKLNWICLEKKIDKATKEEIEKKNLKGIGFEESLVRFYPESSTSAHILGFVGEDSLGEQKGYFGLEGYYDRQLKGVTGERLEEKDASGIPILIGRFFETQAKTGYSLNLNIDKTVQYIAEKKLALGMEKFQAKSGSVIVMDPMNGAILAMANIPSYNPNLYSLFPKSSYINPIVADSYEPGSTFKTIVMAAAINENALTPDTKCDICEGAAQIGGYRIETYNNKYHPDTTMRDVIINSDNIGMIFAGRKLGNDKLFEYIQKFGFGKMTQIDLEDEASPEIRAKKDWKEIDWAAASFGQGIAVTPLQLTLAVASIANGGNLLEPHVVKSITTENKTIDIKTKIVGKTVSPQTAKTVTQMMTDAVEKGEAGSYAPKGFKIAGKTGTAQIPVRGRYDTTSTVASFIGFAPSDNPKFIMLVRYVEPKSSIYGTNTAAPTFFEIAKELFTYYQITPDQI